MERQRVLILCASMLFCEGIHYLLRDEPAIEVIGVEPLKPDSLKRIGKLSPDVVIVAEQDCSPQVMALAGQLLQTHADLPLIRVSLEKDTVQIYQSHRVPASSADLKEVLHHLRGSRTPHVASGG